MTPPTRAPESKTATLRRFINSTASSTLNILKLKTDAAEERILTTAKKALEESNPSLVNFEENLGSEIMKRNQSSNSYLDNKLLRLCHKLKYDSLLTNKKLFEWKVIDSEVCKFCGVDTEDMDHLLNGCEILKQLWDIAEERTLTCWRVKLSQLDKYVGSRLNGAGKRKEEKLFLKVLWCLWGIKHRESSHEKIIAAVNSLKKRIFKYAEILNFDMFD